MAMTIRRYACGTWSHNKSGWKRSGRSASPTSCSKQVRGSSQNGLEIFLKFSSLFTWLCNYMQCWNLMVGYYLKLTYTPNKLSIDNTNQGIRVILTAWISPKSLSYQMALRNSLFSPSKLHFRDTLFSLLTKPKDFSRTWVHFLLFISKLL